MMSYNSSDVIQCLRQYDMFANSLKLIRSNEERSMVVKQLTKLEEKLIDLTNEAYVEEYNALANKECALLDEEKNRVTMLIDLINQRLSYVEKRCNNHYQLTGISIDAPAVLGADELDKYEDELRIIDKYSKNVKLEKELQNDIQSLSNKISLASEKIDINKSLNIELEASLKKTLGDAFEKLGLYTLAENKEEIEETYNETERSLNLAQLNLDTARTSPANILDDCQEMLNDIQEDYIKYKEQVSLLKLMEIFNTQVDNYDELLAKRKQIDELLHYINNKDFLGMVMPLISKQYNTIVMEEQDINTFNDLVIEKDRKMDALSEINLENNSEKFQAVLKVLIENEKKKQEMILEEQKRIEEIEKKKRLEIERRKQEEILKRQRIIEEARKKEIEKRTKQLLEEQQNSVLQKKKEKEDVVSFTTMKDISDDVTPEENIPLEIPKEKDIPLEISALKENNDEEVEKPEKITLFKDKTDIEKELFEEFNSRVEKAKTREIEEEKPEVNVFDKIEEKMSDNKFPDMSLDEYMKNFDENKVEPTESLFDDTNFPSIPM